MAHSEDLLASFPRALRSPGLVRRGDSSPDQRYLRSDNVQVLGQGSLLLSKEVGPEKESLGTRGAANHASDFGSDLSF